MASASPYSELIEIDAERRFGRPCIRGTRIAVSDVLDWFAAGMTEPEIIDDFPELTQQTIRACLAYAADRERDVPAAAE